MTASLQTGNKADKQVFSPDGRQTRIDFFSSGRASKQAPHIQGTRKAHLEWWHVLTGWLKSSKTEQEHHLEDYRKFLEGRKYSMKTIKSYLFMLRKFFAYLDERGIKDLTLGDIEDYNYDFFVSGRYSRSYQLQFINGLALYLEYAQGKKVNLKSLRKTSASR